MILLLGATGLLGHNVLETLLRHGQRVRCIVREGSAIDGKVLATAAEEQLQIIKGSILDDSVLEQGLRGCNAVVNCCGVTDMGLASIDDYRPVNTELPLRLARLLDASGGGVLVSVSTANTVDPGTANRPSDENTPFGGPFTGSLYARSKRDGEKLLLDFAQSHYFTRVVILLPGFIVGPHDNKPSSVAKNTSPVSPLMAMALI